MIRPGAMHIFAPLAALALLPAGSAVARTLTVCPSGAVVAPAGCEFTGNRAIQEAVDQAGEGDTILLKAGTYVPERTRDVPFWDVDENVVVRGFVVIERKSLQLLAEPGVVLDGRAGVPATAIVAKAASVTIRNLVIRNFRYAIEEDDVYDGHGAYLIDSNVTLSDVSIEHFQKMGLSARGTSVIDAANLRIQSGHIGVWVRESAALRLCDSVVSLNEGAGVGAAASGSVRLYGSVLDGNRDDGLYLKDEAAAWVTNSIVTRNKPAGVNAVDAARAVVSYSVLFGNEAVTKVGGGAAQVVLGAGIVERDPKLDSNYRAAVALAGNPTLPGSADAPPGIGLSAALRCGRAR